MTNPHDFICETQYDTCCIGESYGCPEKTNGSQYCCKYYCPFENEFIERKINEENNKNKDDEK